MFLTMGLLGLSGGSTSSTARVKPSPGSFVRADGKQERPIRSGTETFCTLAPSGDRNSHKHTFKDSSQDSGVPSTNES